jgi:hypothetical protein
MRIAFLGACTVLLSQVWAQIPPGGVKTAEFASLPIRIRADSEVSVRWKLSHAELRESVIGVWGTLGVENVAPLSMNWARFYAEYFDNTGRICFTLVFASQANAEHLERDYRPTRSGEMRELLSLASDLGPAVEPVEVRVRLIQDRPESEPLQGTAGNAPIRSPVLINSTAPEPTVRLKLDEFQRSQAMVDMILSKLRVGPNGNLEDVEILQASNPEVRRWFLQLVYQSRLAKPAASGLTNISSTALLLIRIPNDVVHAQAQQLLPRYSNWVKSYIRNVPSKDIPPITQLLLAHSADMIRLPIRLPDGAVQQPKRTTDPDLFEYISPGSS